MIALKDLLKFNNFGQRDDPPSSIFSSKITHDIDDLIYKIDLDLIKPKEAIINYLFKILKDVNTLDSKILEENRLFRTEIERINAVELEYRKKQMRE